MCDLVSKAANSAGMVGRSRAFVGMGSVLVVGKRTAIQA